MKRKLYKIQQKKSFISLKLKNATNEKITSLYNLQKKNETRVFSVIILDK